MRHKSFHIAQIPAPAAMLWYAIECSAPEFTPRGISPQADETMNSRIEAVAATPRSCHWLFDPLCNADTLISGGE